MKSEKESILLDTTEIHDFCRRRIEFPDISTTDGKLARFSEKYSLFILNLSKTELISNIGHILGVESSQLEIAYIQCLATFEILELDIKDIILNRKLREEIAHSRLEIVDYILLNGAKAVGLPFVTCDKRILIEGPKLYQHIWDSKKINKDLKKVAKKTKTKVRLQCFWLLRDLPWKC